MCTGKVIYGTIRQTISSVCRRSNNYFVTLFTKISVVILAISITREVLAGVGFENTSALWRMATYSVFEDKSPPVGLCISLCARPARAASTALPYWLTFTPVLRRSPSHVDLGEGTENSKNTEKP